jgi:4-coumarate--CoA ligase
MVWGGIAKVQELTGEVEFVNVIPKNPSGKILKRVVREMAKKELEQDTVRL